MEKIYVKARAKINLNLLVLNKRKDNYHNIKSIFQKINLYDEIYISKNETRDFKLEINIEELNNNENIIYKAYMLLKEKCKNVTGVYVKVNKRIPLQAGLGGGSTDCASFILGMNKLFDLKLSKKEMEDIGKSLGADVLPCFYNTAVLAEGIGDIITKLNTNFKYYIIVIKPKIKCDTKEMYQKIDIKNEIKQWDSSQQIIEALRNHKTKLLGSNLYNVFENVIEEETINKIKKELNQNGAEGSLMTGSGSCVYGIFKNKSIANLAYKSLKEKYQTYICTSYNSKREEVF